MKTSLKNLLTHTLVFIVPIFSILFLETFLYIPRFSEFWNFLRLCAFYSGIYFWLSFRPDIFNIFSAFILGIFADAISGSPLGINVLTFLFLYIVSTYLISYFNIKKFSYSWLIFSLILCLTFLFKAFMVLAFFKSTIPLSKFILELFLTICLYPLIIRFFIFIEKRYIHLEERYEN